MNALLKKVPLLEEIFARVGGWCRDLPVRFGWRRFAAPNQVYLRVAVVPVVRRARRDDPLLLFFGDEWGTLATVQMLELVRELGDAAIGHAAAVPCRRRRQGPVSRE